MSLKMHFAALAVLAAGAIAGPALAAPAGLTGLSAEPAVTKVDLVTKCWRTPSGRHRCRTVYVNPYRAWNPDRYPVGSTEWWRAMDRQGRGGYRQ
ncbi:MAG: hypothetical protein NW223_24465 [Hyphomicrobiaceae bacterium]|nr:hypothetical protein [Hyphomicrobiaceae bacterium]